MSENEGLVTVKGVLAWNKQNRQRAEKMKAADVYAKPYVVSDSRCRWLCSMKARKREEELLAKNPLATSDDIAAARAHGPADALAELKANASRKLKEFQQELEEARRREKKHGKLLLKEQERLAERRRKMTLAQRVDAIFAQYAVLAGEVKAPSLEARVAGSKDRAPLWDGRRPAPDAPGAEQYNAILEAVKAAEADLAAYKSRRPDILVAA